MKKRSNKMIFSMFIIMLVIYTLLIMNVFSASVLAKHPRSGEDIVKYLDKSTATSTIKSNRGNIYDSSQTVIAEDITSYNLMAFLDKKRMHPNNIPAHVTDVEATANFLAEVLGGEPSYYAGLLNDEDGKKTQTEFGTRGKGLDLKTKNLIAESEFTGLEFTTTTKRHYPLGQFSSQLIGFSDLDQELGKQIGKMGLEKLYNEELTGHDGKSVSTVTLNGYKLPNATSEIIEAKNGSNIYLTTNKNVQLQLEESLAQSMSMANTDKAWAMVQEIETGKIIAMAQAPSFDPEVREGIDYVFYPSDFVFEPGSTMKAITYAAAIEEGLDINKKFDSKTIKFNYDANGRPVRTYAETSAGVVSNASGKSWGDITYAQGFATSSNVGMVEILANELTAEKFEEYLEKFKFFQPTQIDRIEGAAGVKLFDHPRDIVSNTFGQGSTVTMTQMVQAYNAILNDGVMMQPYVVEQIVNSDNEVTYQAEPKEIGRPISKETSQTVKELMYRVVHDELSTGRNLIIDEIDVIAKTGTAQVVIDGKYSSSRYISSISSAFPADNPKYSLFYAYEADYRTSDYFTIVEPINDLVLKIADEYNLISKDYEKEVHEDHEELVITTMPGLINHSVEYANKKLKDSFAEIIIIGDGTNVINQYPNEKDKIISNQRVILYTGEGKITMPDMTGWSRKEVVAFWNASGASFTINGHGNVFNQSVPTGTIVDPNTEIVVSLR